MRIVTLAPIAFVVLLGCAQRSETKTVFNAPDHSPYHATLLTESYNDGETNNFRLRLDADPRGDDGWFFVNNLESDLGATPTPEVIWKSPVDLFVTVHTAMFEGQTRRSFGGDSRPRGTLTVHYIADQPAQ